MHTNIETLIGTVADLEQQFQAKLQQRGNWQLYKVNVVHTPMIKAKTTPKKSTKSETGEPAQPSTELEPDIANIIFAWTIVIAAQ